PVIWAPADSPATSTVNVAASSSAASRAAVLDSPIRRASTRSAGRPSAAVKSKLAADMQRDDAAGQVVIRAALEAGAAHHLAQRLLIRMATDRLGEIAVARGVVGQPLAEPRQHVERVGVVDRVQRPQMRLRELEHEQP